MLSEHQKRIEVYCLNYYLTCKLASVDKEFKDKQDISFDVLTLHLRKCKVPWKQLLARDFREKYNFCKIHV